MWYNKCVRFTPYMYILEKTNSLAVYIFCYSTNRVYNNNHLRHEKGAVLGTSYQVPASIVRNLLYVSVRCTGLLQDKNKLAPTLFTYIRIYIYICSIHHVLYGMEQIYK